MALPTTIVSKGHWAGHLPPFKSSGGNFYVVARRSVTDDSIRVYKATDPSDSWTEQTTGPIVTIASIVSISQDGDVIHMTSYDSGTYEYHQFNMSTDAYDVKDELIETPTNAPTNPWISIAVEGTGVPKVAYAGDTDQVMGGTKERVDVNIRNGGTWDGPTALDAAGDVHYGNPNVIKASDSDDMHTIWSTTANTADPPASWEDMEGRTVTAADSLSTTDTTIFNPTGAFTPLNGVQNLVSFDDSGTIRVVGIFEDNGDTRVIRAEESAGILANSTPDDVIVSTDDFTNGQIKVSSLALLNSDLHAIFADSSQDLKTDTSTDAGVTWGTDSAELTATVNFVSANIYTRGGDTVLAYVYDDGGTTKYNEKILIAGAASTDKLTTLSDPGRSIGAKRVARLGGILQ